MGIPDHLTCLLRNLYAGQEATIRTGHGATDWFQIVKGVHQGCILLPCLFNFHAEYIMWNARLYEAQAWIKIAWRNTNNLRYADDTTLMAEREEELKSFLMKVEEESEKVGLKLNIQKTKIIASSPITSWQVDRQHTKKQRYYFANKGPSSQSYGFSSSHVWMWSWSIKKAELWRVDAFELWCWRRLLRVPWTARRSSQS